MDSGVYCHSSWTSGYSGDLTPAEVPAYVAGHVEAAATDSVTTYVTNQATAFVTGFVTENAPGLTVLLASNALRAASVGFVKPEQVKAFEIGYRGLINNKLKVDVNLLQK